MSDTRKLYHAPASPNSRRVQIFIAEKGIAVPLVAVDLARGCPQCGAWLEGARDRGAA